MSANKVSQAINSILSFFVVSASQRLPQNDSPRNIAQLSEDEFLNVLIEARLDLLKAVDAGDSDESADLRDRLHGLLNCYNDLHSPNDPLTMDELIKVADKFEDKPGPQP